MEGFEGLPTAHAQLYAYVARIVLQVLVNRFYLFAFIGQLVGYLAELLQVRFLQIVASIVELVEPLAQGLPCLHTTFVALHFKALRGKVNRGRNTAQASRKRLVFNGRQILYLPFQLQHTIGNATINGCGV